MPNRDGGAAIPRRRVSKQPSALDAFAVHALLADLHAADGKLGPRDELDLARRAGTIVDVNALPEPHGAYLALTHDQFGQCGCDASGCE